MAKRRRALNERARGLKKFIDLEKKIKMKSNIKNLKKASQYPQDAAAAAAPDEEAAV